MINRAVAAIPVAELGEAWIRTAPCDSVHLIPESYQLQVDASRSNIRRLHNYGAREFSLNAQSPLIAEWLREIRIDGCVADQCWLPFYVAANRVIGDRPPKHQP